MTSAYAALLGVLQGATEFLPVSSSGHLRLAELVLGDMPPSLALEVALHVGTMAAVVLYYRRDLLDLLLSLRPGGDPGNRRLAGLVVLASLPTALIGLGMKKAGVEHLGALAVGGGLLVSSLANFSTGWSRGGRAALTPGRALLVGVVQGLAVLPGVTRSGSTIAAGMALGLSGVEAARFSFLCSVPAVGGAALLTLKDLLELGDRGLPWSATLLGMALSFLVGLACLELLIRQLQTGSFRIWGVYCLLLGAAVLAAFSGAVGPGPAALHPASTTSTSFMSGATG